jgi:SAM-dependent methyltransferase
MDPTPGPTSCDELPYPAQPRPATHPDRLATLAVLLGLEPAALERSRVLELGAADGGNLLPMAHALPGAELVGIDLSARQVADGRARVAELGLANLRLERGDIRDPPADLGRFDYILFGARQEGPGVLARRDPAPGVDDGGVRGVVGSGRGVEPGT